MTDYQAIRVGRPMCQAILIGLFYAAAKYKKVPVPGKALSAGAIAAILQGFSTKARTPLGGRSLKNWALDVAALVLVAYATGGLKVADKTKYTAGALLFGSQMAISNFKPHPIYLDIEAMASKEDCERVYKVLKRASSEVSPKEMIRACETFVLKAMPLIGYEGNGAVHKALGLIGTQCDSLEGMEKLEARLNYVEFFEEIGVSYLDYFKVIDALRLEDPTQKEYLDRWNQRVGSFIRIKWEMRAMTQETDHKEKLKGLSDFIENNSAHLTKEQRLDLYCAFIKRAEKSYSKETWKNSPPQKCLCIAEGYIGSFEKLEKAQALMKFAETLRDTSIRYQGLINEIIPAARDELDEAGKAMVNQWLNEGKGKEIKEDWN